MCSKLCRFIESTTTHFAVIKQKNVFPSEKTLFIKAKCYSQYPSVVVVKYFRNKLHSKPTHHSLHSCFLKCWALDINKLYYRKNISIKYRIELGHRKTFIKNLYQSINNYDHYMKFTYQDAKQNYDQEELQNLFFFSKTIGSIVFDKMPNQVFNRLSKSTL